MSASGHEEIEAVVLGCVSRLNEQRDEGERLETHPDAAIFGDDSPLDSMGLVTLTMDIEDALAEKGIEVSLSDAHVMSQRRSPFRTVGTLVDFINERSASGGERREATG